MLCFDTEATWVDKKYAYHTFSYYFIDQKKYYENSMISIFFILWNTITSIFSIKENTKSLCFEILCFIRNTSLEFLS